MRVVCAERLPGAFPYCGGGGIEDVLRWLEVCDVLHTSQDTGGYFAKFTPPTSARNHSHPPYTLAGSHLPIGRKMKHPIVSWSQLIR